MDSISVDKPDRFSTVTDMEISEFIECADRFPRPDWKELARAIETNPASEWPARWRDVCDSWLAELGSALGEDYELHESDNFVLLTRQDPRDSTFLLRTLERTRKLLLREFGGIVVDNRLGKNVVVIIDSQEDYCDYIAYFYPEEGEFGITSGVFLDGGYSHIAFLQVELSSAESVAVHEFTHACLSHLPIPGWLNEGLAVDIENRLIQEGWRFRGESEHPLTSTWNETNIQDFWSGASFQHWETNRASYDLAYLCVRALARDFTAFRGFILEADADDAGEASALKHYERGLGELIGHFLGNGDWSPKPAQWSKRQDAVE